MIGKLLLDIEQLVKREGARITSRTPPRLFAGTFEFKCGREVYRLTLTRIKLESSDDSPPLIVFPHNAIRAMRASTTTPPVRREDEC